MKRVFLLMVVAALALLQPSAWAGPARAVTWDDLMPADQDELMAKARVAALIRGAPHGSFSDQNLPMNQLQPGLFRTIEALNGAHVRIKGYLVPLDMAAGTTKEFLLVPYYGACIHAPPPPPNQTIHVRSAKPVKIGSLSAAVEIEGIMSTIKVMSEMGDAAYSLSLVAVKAIS